MLADALDVGLELINVEQFALDCLKTGIANETGATARQGNGPVPALLETTQIANGQQTAEVQRRGRWVKSRIRRDAALVEAREYADVGYLVHQAPKVPVIT